ncbi:MAG: ketoacyl-ACP synthase III [Candidatus Latescibacteria bacterium]|nr:ketoacyl-ACP synthase III [Candidatus Latescibacterota bacterium]
MIRRGTPFNAMITGIAHYLPERRLTNADLEQMVETTDEWIRTRTGISERRILEKGKGTSVMAIEAAKRLMEQTGLTAEEIDLIIVGTVTPDMYFPSTACLVQDAIGAKNAWGFDVLGACCGFIYTLTVGAQFIETGAHKKVVVIGADKMSSIMDYTDRQTCVLFGDAAGAVLLEPTTDPEMGILDFIHHIDGSGGQYLYMPGGGSLHPPTHETVEKKMHYVHQDGQAVFKFAVVGMAEVSEDLLKQNGLTGSDIALFVPHQANLRIIESSAKRMKLDPSKVAITIDKYGNTTSGTIPVSLSEAVDEGLVKKGDLIVMSSFGAGFTWGSVLTRWGY